MNNIGTARLILSDWISENTSRYIKQDASGYEFMEKLLLHFGIQYTSNLRMFEIDKVIIQSSHAIQDGKLTLKLIDSIVNKKPKVKVKAKKAKRNTSANYPVDQKWLRVRYQALKLSNGKCVLCGLSAKDGIKLHVDHIKPKSKFPHLAYNVNNLQVMCEMCNVGKSNIDDTDWR